MAVLTTVFSFSVIQILTLVTSIEADPQIEVNPPEISLGLSSSLDINCTFSVTDHPEMAGFVSLILARANSSGQTFQDLAAVTEFSPDSVTLMTQERVTATAVYSQTGQSYLHLTWDFPTDSQAGVYKCTAHGLGTLGQQMEAVNISTVTVNKANLNDIFEKLKQMEIHETAMENKMSELDDKNVGLENRIQALEYNNSQMSSYITDQDNTIAGMEKNIQDLQNNNSQMSSYITDQDNTITGMEKNIQDLQNNNSQMRSYITDQDNTITGMEKNIQDLQNNNSQMSSYITDLEQTVASVRQVQRMNFIGAYKNHDYYVSRDGFDEINNVMNVCKSCGGYLVEIDNRDEFNAVKGYLDNTSGFCCVYIAGTDEASDGTWVFQSNNQPLPFSSWYSTGAPTGTRYNCLELLRSQSWNMKDWYCHIDPHDTSRRYMCEIPRV